MRAAAISSPEAELNIAGLPFGGSVSHPVSPPGGRTMAAPVQFRCQSLLPERCCPQCSMTSARASSRSERW